MKKETMGLIEWTLRVTIAVLTIVKLFQGVA